MSAPGGRRQRSWAILSLGARQERLRCYSEPQRGSVEACVRDEFRHLEPGVMHTRLDGISGYADDLGDLVDRFLVVVNEIDHLAMRGRQTRQAFPKDCAPLVFLERNRLIVRLIFDRRGHPLIQLRLRAASKYRTRLVAANPQQPRRDLGAALEFSGLAPSVEKYFAHEVLSRRLITDQTQGKAEDAYIMSGEEYLNRVLVAFANRFDERFVRWFPPIRAWVWRSPPVVAYAPEGARA